MYRHPSAFFSLLCFLCLSIGCNLDSKEIKPAYQRYKFDTGILNKIPIYDSLASAILAHFSFFQKHINEQDSYRSYKYRPAPGEADVYNHFPPGITPKINQYYSRLGKGFIYGFDVFSDSSIKIYVKKKHLDTLQIDILENLSYYPSGSKMQARAFPVKDTILNEHWQYWIFFHKPRLSFWCQMQIEQSKVQAHKPLLLFLLDQTICSVFLIVFFRACYLVCPAA